MLKSIENKNTLDSLVKANVSINLVTKKSHLKTNFILHCNEKPFLNQKWVLARFGIMNLKSTTSVEEK